MNNQLPAVRNSNLLMIAHVIYGIYAFSAISAASVIGIVFGFLGLVGVILAHVYRTDAQGTWLASHYDWLIKTFWWSSAWGVLGWVFFVTLVGIPVSFAIWGFAFLWLAYRIIRGWINLFREQTV